MTGFHSFIHSTNRPTMYLLWRQALQVKENLVLSLILLSLTLGPPLTSNPFWNKRFRYYEVEYNIRSGGDSQFQNIQIKRQAGIIRCWSEYDGSCLTRRNSGRKEILAFSSPNINKHKQTSFAFLYQIRGKLKRSVAGMEAWDEWFLKPEEIMILFKQDLCFYFQQKETNIYKVMQSIFPNVNHFLPCGVSSEK